MCSYSEMAMSVICTGFSAAPQAKAHWDQSNHCKGPAKWGHRLVAVIERIPVIGGIIGLVDYLFCSLVNYLFYTDQMPDQSNTSSKTTQHKPPPKKTENQKRKEPTFDPPATPPPSDTNQDTAGALTKYMDENGIKIGDDGSIEGEF